MKFRRCKAGLSVFQFAGRPDRIFLYMQLSQWQYKDRFPMDNSHPKRDSELGSQGIMEVLP